MSGVYRPRGRLLGAALALLASLAAAAALSGCSTILALMRGPPLAEGPSAVATGSSPVSTAPQEPPAGPSPSAGAVSQPAAPGGSTGASVDSVLPGKVDFPAIVHLGQVYRSMRYDSLAQIHVSWDPYYDEVEVVDIEQSRNRYMVGTLAAQHVQEILVRGTANLPNALSDVAFAKYWDPELKMYIHRGFDTMARILENNLSPHLRSGYDLVIFGHSLGAAEAVILGMLLAGDGWNVKAIYASGQPRLTDGEGCRNLEKLPIVRIISEGDPVPLVPPPGLYADNPFRHAGSAIVLLDGPYYCVVGGPGADEALNADFKRTFTISDLREDIARHFIVPYLERETPKLVAPQQVAYADRARYLAPSPHNPPAP